MGQWLKSAAFLLSGLFAVVIAGVALQSGPSLVTAMRGFDPPRLAAPKPIAVELPSADGNGSEKISAWLYAPPDTPREDGQAKALLVYMPGWGGRARDNNVLLRTLAAAGYPSVAVDDPALDQRRPGESDAQHAARTARYDMSSPDGPEAFSRTADAKVAVSVGKLGAVIDRLSVLRAHALNGAGPTPSQSPDADQSGLSTLAAILGRLARPRFAAIGFSFGGSTAFEALHRDERVVAAVNLDGWLYASAATAQVSKPSLHLLSQSLPVFPIGAARINTLAFDDISRARLARQKSFAPEMTTVISIPGALHDDFADGLHWPTRWRSWRPWKPPLPDPGMVRRTIDAAVVRFLDRVFVAVR